MKKVKFTDLLEFTKKFQNKKKPKMKFKNILINSLNLNTNFRN